MYIPIITLLIFYLIPTLSAQELPVHGYELVWADEFENAKLDLAKWRHRSLGPRKDAINIKEAVEVHPGGFLVIKTERVANEIFTGMISTQNRFMPTYGYFETRVFLPRERGMWAAFWLQSPTVEEADKVVAKAGAEVDIFEYLGNNIRRVNQALHWNGYGPERESRNKKSRVRELRKGWHTFGLEWTAEGYTYYVNGEPTWSIQEGVSQRSQYLILSIEVGEWAGKIKRADLPENFVVDYVRVYQKADAQN